MRKILTLAAIAIMGIAVFSGCSKKSSSPSYGMKATIGSTAYNAPYCLASSTSGVLVIDGLGGSATAPTPPYVTIVIPSWTSAAGTFNLDSTMTANYAEYILSDTVARISKTGSVIITSVTSTSIAGTFSFSCTDGTAVSSGSFTAKR